MSTVVILGSAHPFRGGLASYNERLALEYQREGHNVVVYTFSLQYPSFLFPGKTQYSESPKPQNLDIRIRVNSTNPLNWLSVGNEIRNLKPDLLIVKYWLPFMGPCFGSVCRLVKRNKHTRVVSILDNVVPHEPRAGDAPFTKYFIGGIDAAVAMSQSVLDDFKRFAPAKPVLLSPHPAFDNFGERESKEQAKQHLKIDPRQPVLLFFGFIRDYKGLDWLLQAIAKIDVMQLPFKLLIAGEFYTDAQRYRDLIQQLNLQDKVILHTHFINDEDVRHYFCAADMVVQPYK
ncbi:MAG TPA: glycosyltransferase, partial [Chitinophagales bacterium]|nr:glycosyltransferase [Chitinophagales bacterium]